MARRFGRNLENSERRIENEGEFSQTVVDSSLEEPYEDNFDELLDKMEIHTEPPKLKEAIKSLEHSKRRKFMQNIKVEQPQMDTQLMLAYQELDRARQSRNREDIIKAEDKILDLERQEEEKGYNVRIAELKRMQKEARESNDSQRLEQFKKTRKSFIAEMKYDELNYKIKKLQNSQRLQPSRDKLLQIIELKKEFETLMDEISK